MPRWFWDILLAQTKAEGHAGHLLYFWKEQRPDRELGSAATLLDQGRFGRSARHMGLWGLCPQARQTSPGGRQSNHGAAPSLSVAPCCVNIRVNLAFMGETTRMPK